MSEQHVEVSGHLIPVHLKFFHVLSYMWDWAPDEAKQLFADLYGEKVAEWHKKAKAE